MDGWSMEVSGSEKVLLFRRGGSGRALPIRLSQLRPAGREPSGELCPYCHDIPCSC